MDPMLEIMKIKGINIFDLLLVEPFYIKFEIIFNLFTVKDSIYHMTAE